MLFASYLTTAQERYILLTTQQCLSHCCGRFARPMSSL